VKVRTIDVNDRKEWARMRNPLWSDSIAGHLNEIERYFAQAEIHGEEKVFVLARDNDKLGGFIELKVRNYAEGSQSAQVPYVEGWYVDRDLRGYGYGRQLIEIAEIWAQENGFEELASDAELGNVASITAHKALGFKEVERIVCFLKKLN
jgi:aminoglycoside 6'-N-acetyltransferase I